MVTFLYIKQPKPFKILQGLKMLVILKVILSFFLFLYQLIHVYFVCSSESNNTVLFTDL